MLTLISCLSEFMLLPESEICMDKLKWLPTTCVCMHAYIHKWNKTKKNKIKNKTIELFLPKIYIDRAE